jgi:hypothetical protein
MLRRVRLALGRRLALPASQTPALTCRPRPAPAHLTHGGLLGLLVAAEQPGSAIAVAGADLPGIAIAPAEYGGTATSAPPARLPG